MFGGVVEKCLNDAQHTADGSEALQILKVDHKIVFTGLVFIHVLLPSSSFSGSQARVLGFGANPSMPAVKGS